MAPQKQRSVYTANNADQLPGKLLRGEGQPPSKDKQADEAYDGLGATFDFYLDAYQRNSINNAGLPLTATVHYDNKYNNAFWNGDQMVFGDGDGVLFNPFTGPVDVIGHELTHGVTGSEANLIYRGQPGALNESLSDVFGSMVKQYAHNPKQSAADADWLIGEGLLTFKGQSLRSMKAPGTAYDNKVMGKDPQPADMKHYIRTAEDNGGVHLNSGIPNRAFYLAATKIGGFAWEKAGQIWYDTLTDRALRPNAMFAGFARRTAINAAHRYGMNSPERKAVLEAWAEVGVVLKPAAAGAAG
jgi:Zn-dependent metalloprotease